MVEKPSVIIFCAGIGETWNNYLGIPKQLIPLNHTPLLHRTVSMARQYSQAVTIVSWDPALRVEGAEFYELEKTRFLAETILRTKHLWRKRTAWLLGDVFFSPAAMRALMRSRSSLRFFGRMEPYLYGGGKPGELFGAAFLESEHVRLEECVQQAYQDALRGGRGKLWQVYRAAAGIPLREHRYEPLLLRQIFDITDDIDSPEDYHRMIPLYLLATKPSVSAQLKWNWQRMKVELPFSFLRVCRKISSTLKRLQNRA